MSHPISRTALAIGLLAVVAAAAGTGCAAPDSAPQDEPIGVTAADIDRLPAGASYDLDLSSHSYRFDGTAGAIDYSRVVIGASEPIRFSDLLASAASRAGVSVEAFTKKPFVVEEDHTAAAPETTGDLAPKARWCSVEVWIAPEGPDDVFRIGHVWVWKRHC